jgi:hypothetical protein
MRRHAAVLGICVTAWSAVARAEPPAPPPAPAPAPASGTPGADQIQFAAREHDLGYRAYLEKQYDEAASHFENAFFAAPNPAELRSAIRARRDGGELARAATLAAIGLRRFPDDSATAKVAADVIAQAKSQVYEVQISSPAEYSVAVDEKIVAAERVKETRVFVTPGTHQLLVSWSDDRSTRIPIDAREGGSQSLQLEPPAPAAPSPVVPVVPPGPVVAPPPAPAVVTPPAVVAPPPQSKPFGPAVFIVGAGLTTVGVGLIVWSGIDTLNNPGQDAVRNACSNGWTGTCPSTYSKGASAEARTNIFIAITSGLGAATAIVGLFFTDWSAPISAGRSVPGGAPRVAPFVGVGQAGVEGSF